MLPAHLVDRIVAGAVLNDDVRHGQSELVHVFDPVGCQNPLTWLTRRNGRAVGKMITRVDTHALPDVLPPRRMADSDRRDQCGQGRGDPGPAPRERGATPGQLAATVGLGRPGHAQRPDKTPPPRAEDAPARHACHGPALASATGRPSLDLPEPA